MLLDYLTPQAVIAFYLLTSQGLDPELALAYLEANCGEAMYDIPVFQEEIDERKVS